MLITRVLQKVAAEAPRRRGLPEARYLWLTAQLIPNRVVQDRALKPIGVLQVLAYIIVAGCWAVVLTWKWSNIKDWFHAPELGARLTEVASGSGSVPLSFLVIVGGLLCITSVVVMHSVLAEE
jgi:hypothetical protein